MSAGNGKLWGKIDNGQIEIRTMTPDDVEEALDVLNESFFIDENVCVGCEINLPENSKARAEMRELCRITAKDGISMVAKDAISGNIVGTAFNKIQYIPVGNEEPYFEKFTREHVQTPQAKRLMDFMGEVNSGKDVFKAFNLNCVVELTFLGTLPAYRRRGIATALERYTIEYTRELSQGIGVDALPAHVRGKRPQAVTAIYSSKFSRKAGETNNFKVLNSVSHDEVVFNGKTFAERINNPEHYISDHVIHLV